MIKQEETELFKELTRMCNRVWTKEKVPEDWKEGIIIPIPKGDLRECTTWRGITLILTPGKVMTVILLNQIRNAVDEKLSQEQAGLRPGRSCCEQIFTLAQIIEITDLFGGETGPSDDQLHRF